MDDDDILFLFGGNFTLEQAFVRFGHLDLHDDGA